MSKIILVFSLFIALVSCKRESEQKYYYVPQELKSRYLFQPGSYWVYEDSMTHALDTIKVTKITHEMPMNKDYIYLEFYHIITNNSAITLYNTDYGLLGAVEYFGSNRMPYPFGQYIYNLSTPCHTYNHFIGYGQPVGTPLGDNRVRVQQMFLIDSIGAVKYHYLLNDTLRTYYLCQYKTILP